MITVENARVHLRVDNQDSAEVEYKLAEAIAIAAVYTGKDPAILPFDLTRWATTAEAIAAEAPAKASWQDRAYDAAILLILGELWMNREAGTADPLSPAVKSLLASFKPLVFA